MVGAGVRMITDDGSPVSNPQVLRRAMEYAREFGLVVASHCETMELSAKGAMNEGNVSYKLGIPGIPAISEEICIERDIAIARHTRSRLHIQHVTTARGVEIIRRAKDEGCWKAGAAQARREETWVAARPAREQGFVRPYACSQGTSWWRCVDIPDLWEIDFVHEWF